MSKEKTLTAEEFLKDGNFEFRVFPEIGVDIIFHCEVTTVSKVMEQYAKAKVLEALEREVPKAWRDGLEAVAGYGSYNTSIEYLEKEVKPKYK